ncbi:MAG: 16S rRNA (cytidine(1402)-2'-O)-methyltransferase [Gammaproteobacteria bacterium]|nr:MAG: 16S rRNA (cytidine(1402)-2'-O)-methyltransferase [Gammaproteobacteria bacterium]
MTAATLYIVATPIGNLDDLSPRARQVLESVDLVAAEDTRHTGRLLAHFCIAARQIALHEHNESEVVAGIIGKLLGGQSVALVSDAGTPLIRDPGYRLVRAAHDAGITVTPIPGASAAVAALSAAGLPGSRFAFEGFLPAKREARLVALRLLQADRRTLLFFESVHRIEASLADMAEVFGAGRRAFIGREISKLHEQCVHATLQRLCDMLAAGEIASRGEFVVAVAGAPQVDTTEATVDASELLRALLEVLPGSQAVDLVSKLSGRKRNDVYKEMLRYKSA